MGTNNEKVGALEETITLTGACHAVDTYSVRSQTVLGHDVFEVIPVPQGRGGNQVCGNYDVNPAKFGQVERCCSSVQMWK